MRVLWTDFIYAPISPFVFVFFLLFLHSYDCLWLAIFSRMSALHGETFDLE